jgi:hypothetical protein
MNLKRGRVRFYNSRAVTFHCGLAARMRTRHAHGSAFALHLLAAGVLCGCHVRIRNRAHHRRGEQRQQKDESCCCATDGVHSATSLLARLRENNRTTLEALKRTSRTGESALPYTVREAILATECCTRTVDQRRAQHFCRHPTKPETAHSDGAAPRRRFSTRPARNVGRHLRRVRTCGDPCALHAHLALACPHPLSIASRHGSSNANRRGTESPARCTLIADQLPTVRVSEVRTGLPGRARDPAVRKPAGQMRGVSLQPGRHARLGVFPDQHRTPEETGRELARFTGLQGEYRFRVSTVCRESGFQSLERVQQRALPAIPRRVTLLDHWRAGRCLACRETTGEHPGCLA